jgi:hypothetical protein
VCLYNMPLLYPNVFECFKLQAILAIWPYSQREPNGSTHHSSMLASKHI